MSQVSTNVFSPISTAYSLFPSGPGAPIFSCHYISPNNTVSLMTHFLQQHISTNNRFPSTNPLFSFSPITCSPSLTPSTPSNRLSLPLYIEQQIHDTNQNSITHTNLLNQSIYTLSGMGLEPGAEPTHQQPHQPQQLRQFPTLTPERILQF